MSLLRLKIFAFLVCLRLKYLKSIVFIPVKKVNTCQKDRLRRIASGLFEFLYFVGERVVNFKSRLAEQILNYIVLFKRIIERFKFKHGFFKEIFYLVRAVATDDAVRQAVNFRRNAVFLGFLSDKVV